MLRWLIAPLVALIAYGVVRVARAAGGSFKLQAGTAYRFTVIAQPPLGDEELTNLNSILFDGGMSNVTFDLDGDGFTLVTYEGQPEAADRTLHRGSVQQVGPTTLRLENAVELASDTKTRVVRVDADGHPYFVVALGGGQYEVRREDRPDVFVVLDQNLATTGPLASGGDAVSLEELKHDMKLFPSTMFT
jgi:hypothetical protein